MPTTDVFSFRRLLFLYRFFRLKTFRLLLGLAGFLWVIPEIAEAATSLWQALPLVTQASLSVGNSGGEGCQVIQNLAIDSTGQFLLMGTDVGGVFRSTNGGANWQPADVGFAPRGACAFAIDPNNNQRVLAVGDNSGAQSWNGLWLSTTQASAWTPVLQKNMQGSGTYHDSVAFDASSGTLSAGISMSAVAYWVNYSDGGGGLWKSTNGGNSWSQVQSSFSDGIVKVNPSTGAVYVATANGFYLSTNGGSSFTQVVSGPVLGLDVIATQPNNVYINETNGVYLSTNAGASFTKMASTGLPTTDSPGLRNLKVSPANPNAMLVDDDQGSYTSQNYYYSTNGGASWSACSLNSSQSFIPLNTREWLFAWNPANASQAWACGGDFISQSTDGGAHFSWSANGYNDFTCTGYFNFNPQNPNLLLVTSQDYNSAFTAAATAASPAWQYLNVSGQGWGGFTYGGYALSSTVFAAGNSPSWGAAATLMVSSNGGSSFNNTGLVGNNTQSACGDPVSATVAFWDQYRTVNGGGSWAAMSACDGVFTYDSNPSGSFELYGAKGSEVVKSTDHGATWTNVAGVNSTVIDIACDWKNGKIYVVDSQGDLFTAPLAGGTATMITSRLATDNQGNQGAYSVAVDPVDPNVVYTAWTGNSYISSQAVRRSVDGGQTWTPLTLQPGDTGLDGGRESECVRVNPATRWLYSAGSCFGVWKYPPPASAGTATATPVVFPTVNPPTATATPTRTPSATPTLTATRTPVSTLTATGTSTPTLTPANTSTGTATATPTRTATPTSTLPAATVSLTPSSTASRTPTASSTATVTPTSTWTASRSPTPGLTATATPTLPPPTHTLTASATASNTPTASFTSSWTPSSTSAGSPTFTSTSVPATGTATPPAGSPTPKDSGAAIGTPLPYPNPVYGGASSVEVRLWFGADDTHGRLEVMTVSGRRVEEIALGTVQRGTMTVSLPLSDSRGVPLANGVYFLVVKTTTGQAVGKMLI